MASLHRKPRSPFWYLRYLDKTGAWKSKSTGYRAEDAKETAAARVFCAQRSEKELADDGKTKEGKGWEFVPKFLADHYRNPISLQRMQTRWEWVSLFLSKMDLGTPSAIRYQHGQAYVDWRTTFKKRTGKVAARNTAIYEVKSFALIMKQAVRLEMCLANPLTNLGIKKDTPAEKPEITDAEFEILLAGIKKEPQWLRDCFLIGMHTGCRLRETVIAARGINLTKNTLTFFKPKGGEKRAFSIPMPPALRPVFTQMLSEHRGVTLEMPFQPSRQFQHFFHRLGMDHLCFHCLRVTFITRLQRASVPLGEAMRRVNHASEEIHRIYQRMTVDDLQGRPLSLYDGLAA
jgi:integrase